MVSAHQVSPRSDATGGFDTTLRTAEDIDFLLRVALRFQIAVVAEPLTRAKHDHGGLSELKHSYHDHVAAVERFVSNNRRELPRAEGDAALFCAYIRNVRGFLFVGDLPGAARIAAGAVLHVRSTA